MGVSLLAARHSPLSDQAVAALDAGVPIDAFISAACDPNADPEVSGLALAALDVYLRRAYATPDNRLRRIVDRLPARMRGPIMKAWCDGRSSFTPDEMMLIADFVEAITDGADPGAAFATLVESMPGRRSDLVAFLDAYDRVAAPLLAPAAAKRAAPALRVLLAVAAAAKATTETSERRAVSVPVPLPVDSVSTIRRTGPPRELVEAG